MTSDLQSVVSATSLTSDVKDIDPGQYMKLQNTYLAAFSSLLYILAMGMVASYSAPATMDMKQPGSRVRNITVDEITWIASLNMLSGILGNLVTGYASNKVGRRGLLIYLSPFYVVSWLLIAYAPSVAFLYLGRILSGFTAGICTALVPAYLVEISIVEIRGLLTNAFHIAVGLGLLITYGFGIILRWSWLAVVGAIVVSAGTCLMLFMPESPSWLVRKHRNAEASLAIKFLRGEFINVEKEMKIITENLSKEPKGSIVLKEIVTPNFYKPFVISFFLALFSAFCGFASMMSYTVEIFQSVGSSLDPNVSSAILGAVSTLVAGVGSMLIDKAGRRALYMASGGAMTASLVFLGLYIFLDNKYHVNLSHLDWIPLISFIIYIASHSLGLGSIPFVMIPEIVPFRYRSLLLSILTIFMSVFAFTVAKTFESLRALCGDYGVYWIYGSFSFLSIIFCWFVLPETKGRTVEEINQAFSTVSNAAVS